MKTHLTIQMLFPVPCVDGGIAHTAFSTCRYLNGDGVEARMTVPKADAASRAPFVRAVLPRCLNRIPYRFIRRFARQRVEDAFLSSLRPSQPVYLWSDVSRECLEALREMGACVIREKFNCHRRTARRILAAEYERLRMPWEWCVITERDVERERAELSLVDFVSSPSPLATRSLIDEGIEPQRIIETSYGWCPERFGDRAPSARPREDVTVAFVGAVCVRKGAHLLLDAWRRGRVRGRLVLCGVIEPAIERRFRDTLNRSDVVVLGHRGDVGSVYRAADLLVFPTLEEGSPLVTYEAMAHGVPIVTTPMGASAAVRDDVEGLIFTPGDTEPCLEAMRRMAGDRGLREHCGRAAALRAQQFTWACAGARKRRLFAHSLSSRPESIIAAAAELERAA